MKYLLRLNRHNLEGVAITALVFALYIYMWGWMAFFKSFAIGLAIIVGLVATGIVLVVGFLIIFVCMVMWMTFDLPEPNYYDEYCAALAEF